MQHDLFPRAPFSITPEPERKEPRLWVRCLVIWREPGEIIRSIDLKPGLNVVWSRDPGSNQTGPIGHGGGKTMFCRLLRYCLGEESFAPESQRHRIGDKIPKGRVGAEVLLDGQLWVVVRSLGIHRHDVVIKGGSLEDASLETAAATGIAPLRDALLDTILGDAASLFPRTIAHSAAWETTLAWITRDQECRFGGHLEWRDPHSDSHSPVRGRSMEDRLAVVRALIAALTPAEITTQQAEEEAASKEKNMRAELGQVDWESNRARARLATALGLAAGTALGRELDAAHFKSAASARYAEALRLPVDETINDLERARSNRAKVADELLGQEKALSDVTARIDEKHKSLGQLRGELPTSRARLTKENNPVCPICEVPIDKALTEGCGISTATCDLHALQQKIENLRKAIDDEESNVKSLEGQRPSLQHAVAGVRQRLTSLDQSIAALERGLLDKSTTIREARRLVEDADRYEVIVSERTELSSSIETAAAQVAARRGELAAHRETARDSIIRLSNAFDAILRELVPGKIEGEAKLDGNGLSLTAKLDGERSTAAIDSLKVVAFDLAALALTIEGRTSLPAFLVHDSPREADLGRSIYDRLFEFAKKLEGFGPSPLFQYIITTTTEPPGEFHADPWLRLEVHGAPAAERLLKVDL
jgi:predicted  nucleic acid-binding Zn-ribbon protein